MVNIYESQEFFERIIRQWMQLLVITEKWAASFGLTVNSFWVMYNLYRSGAGMKQIELVKQTMLSKQTISYLANHLISRGLVQYSREGNSRFVLVLTKEGEGLMERILDEVRAVGVISMGGLSDKGSQEFDEQMRRFTYRAMEGFLKGVQ